ncbi:MAG: S49 family peptidase [Rhodospirillales bacterium]|nr:S49 family peptidase [Rhodospirillales bacterium]
MIELHGLIAARFGQLNLRAAAPLIEKGFAAARGRDVILDIDSPGGSPVQSELIATLIRRRAETHKVTVHAVIGELGASGGYWLACAADRILANPMSIVGSIGVRGGGFGFPALLARIGVERRLYTAGAHKARLDPFLPENEDDIAFTRELLDALHARFKDWVRARRAGRLLADEATLFDGGYMLGARAVETGLIDGLSDVDALVRALGGEKARPMRLRPRPPGLLRRLPRLAIEAALDAAEDRATRPAMRL